MFSKDEDVFYAQCILSTTLKSWKKIVVFTEHIQMAQLLETNSYLF